MRTVVALDASAVHADVDLAGDPLDRVDLTNPNRCRGHRPPMPSVPRRRSFRPLSSVASPTARSSSPGATSGNATSSAARSSCSPPSPAA
jgi:hypothetical protein